MILRTQLCEREGGRWRLAVFVILIGKKETKNREQDVKYMYTTWLISHFSVEIVSYGDYDNGNKRII